jgi:RNA polymerase sigma-70 factor (ECF subfamily)
VFIVSSAFVDLEYPDSPGLLERARQGDSDAFSQLCRIHGTRLLRQATALCGNATQAEDLAQETLLAAWRSLHRYNGQCRLFTWLCAILLNRHRSALRDNRPLAFAFLRRPERVTSERVLAHLADGGSAPDQTTASADEAACLGRCLARLAPKHREVIHLRFYVDDSLEGIAAALGCTVGTVKSRLFYALDQLRAMRSRDLEELKSK